MLNKAKYKVWWDEKEGIIRQKAWGDFEEKDAKAQSIQINNIINSQSGKVLVLNDLSESGKASSQARKIYSEMMKNEKVKKHAFVGMKIMTKVIVSFIINFSGAKNVRLFNTEEEAIKWLKEDT